MQEHKYLTAAEAAELLNVSTATVRRLARSGRLPKYRIGSKAVRFREDDVLALLVPVDERLRA